MEIPIRDFGVLFICTHNSARSQMAEGYLRARYGKWFEAMSAGTEVRGIHPLAVAVMAEIGIDISQQRSKLINEFSGTRIGVVVSLCDSAYQVCPFFPGTIKTIHAGFPDPQSCQGRPDDCVVQFRNVRDAIIRWVDQMFVRNIHPVVSHFDSRLPVFKFQENGS